MSEFVRYVLDDGTEVVFESAESSLVQQHSGDPDVRDGGRLSDRLRGVAEAAEQVSAEMRARLAPHEVSLEFGLKVSGELNWWFFAKAQSEGTIKVTLKWTDRRDPPAADRPADQPEVDPAAAVAPAAGGE